MKHVHPSDRESLRTSGKDGFPDSSPSHHRLQGSRENKCGQPGHAGRAYHLPSAPDDQQDRRANVRGARRERSGHWQERNEGNDRRAHPTADGGGKENRNRHSERRPGDLHGHRGQPPALLLRQQPYGFHADHPAHRGKSRSDAQGHEPQARRGRRRAERRPRSPALVVIYGQARGHQCGHGRRAAGILPRDSRHRLDGSARAVQFHVLILPHAAAEWSHLRPDQDELRHWRDGALCRAQCHHRPRVDDPFEESWRLRHARTQLYGQPGNQLQLQQHLHRGNGKQASGRLEAAPRAKGLQAGRERRQHLQRLEPEQCRLVQPPCPSTMSSRTG